MERSQMIRLKMAPARKFATFHLCNHNFFKPAPWESLRLENRTIGSRVDDICQSAGGTDDNAVPTNEMYIMGAFEIELLSQSWPSFSLEMMCRIATRVHLRATAEELPAFV
jgi:hypothetical protein